MFSVFALDIVMVMVFNRNQLISISSANYMSCGRSHCLIICMMFINAGYSCSVGGTRFCSCSICFQFVCWLLESGVFHVSHRRLSIFPFLLLCVGETTKRRSLVLVACV